MREKLSEMVKSYEFKKGKVILITGAAGFIGFHLSKRLLEDGRLVVRYDNISDYFTPYAA